MSTLDVLAKRAARMKTLAAKLAEKKKTAEARRTRKLMKRLQRKALPLKKAAAAAAKAKAKAEAEKAKAEAEAKPAEAAS